MHDLDAGQTWPVIVDPGSGVYDGASFSPRRYEHWYNAGRSHAVPTIDGQEQARPTFTAAENQRLYSEGPAAIFNKPPYGAQDVTVTTEDDGAITRVEMNLTGCYESMRKN